MVEETELLADRRRVYDLIAQTPGLTARQVQAAAALEWGATTLQLLRLEEAGHLTRLRGSELEFYFPRAVRPADPITRRLAGSVAARRALLTLLERPGMTLAGLAMTLRRGPGSLSEFLRPMVRAGIVVREGEGETATLRIADRRRLGEIVGVRSGALSGFFDGAGEVYGELFPTG